MKEVIDLLKKERQKHLDEAKRLTDAINLIMSGKSDTPSEPPIVKVVANMATDKREYKKNAKHKSVKRNIGGTRQFLLAQFSFGDALFTAKDVYDKIKSEFHGLPLSKVEWILRSKSYQKRLNCEVIDGQLIYSNIKGITPTIKEYQGGWK